MNNPMRWYCGRCKKEFVASPVGLYGTQKPECPTCKGKTDYWEIFELESL